MRNARKFTSPRHGGRAGFTFVEMMITGTILVSVATLATLWLTGVSNLWSLATTQSDVRIRAQETMNRVVDELRSATRSSALGSPPNATIPASPNNLSVTFYLPADVDLNGLIVDANGNTEWGVGNPIQYAYDANQRQLLRTVGGVNTVIANDVSAATFKDRSIDGTLNTNEIQIALTLQRTTTNGRAVSATATEIVKLRN